MPIDYVLYEMSYANMVLYGTVLPSYKSKENREKGKKGKRQEVIKVDDVRNREKLKKVLERFD